MIFAICYLILNSRKPFEIVPNDFQKDNLQSHNLIFSLNSTMFNDLIVRHFNYDFLSFHPILSFLHSGR